MNTKKLSDWLAEGDDPFQEYTLGGLLNAFSERYAAAESEYRARIRMLRTLNGRLGKMGLMIVRVPARRT